MNLESLTDKQLHELERLLTEITHLMKQAKLTDDPLHATLTQLKHEAGALRQKRYDEHDSRFSGY